MAGTVIANLGAPTSTTISQPGKIGTGFQWVDNGSGGVNYFRDGTPITREQFASGSGQDVGGIENWVSQQYNNNQATNSPAATGTGGGTSSTTNPAAAALYDQQAKAYEDQIAQLDPALGQTMADIGSGYNKSVNTQKQAFSDATQSYNTTKTNDTANEQTTQQGIREQTRQQGDALQRLLGLAGSGNSSAATVAAPYYVGQNGAASARGAQTTFGQNQQALDTSFNKATRDNNTALDDLAQQEFSAQQSAKGANASAKVGLLDQIIAAVGNSGSAQGLSSADVTAKLQPFIDARAQAVRDSAGSTGKYAAPVYQTNPNIYTPPTISSYAAGISPLATAAPTPAPNAGQNITAVAPPKPQDQKPLLASLAA